ncbi:DUF6168 family protein [Lutimonas zeaxanthinifaciens]|uniref:DUF6168 family protein n=1 Tax=Lutimonas zeaxanthinifaciens TaxID=3060215 RepID=UPI00265CA3AE|nr:DUF6168 family protein [Lutimonas sp. YSD2104]WKK66573.1 DUF6168 family protein [Lutimonas sp. YSD2104]
MRPLFKFSSGLIIILSVVFAIHIFILQQFDLPLFENRIIEAYVINCVLAILIYFSLYYLKNKMAEQLGFLYMGGSFIKFLFFFIFFYPFYKQDGGLDSLEFAAFFVPYVISLIFETFGVIEFLKK